MSIEREDDDGSDGGDAEENTEDERGDVGDEEDAEGDNDGEGSGADETDKREDTAERGGEDESNVADGEEDREDEGSDGEDGEDDSGSEDNEGEAEDGGDDDGDSDPDIEYVDEVEGWVDLEYGETAHVSNGVNVTVNGVSIYRQMGGELPEERDVFAVLEVETENTDDEQRCLPDAIDGWEVFFGDRSVSQTFNISALDAEGYTQLAGGDVQGGVSREGAVLFEVKSGYDVSDLIAFWIDDSHVAAESDHGIDVRWRGDL